MLFTDPGTSTIRGGHITKRAAAPYGVTGGGITDSYEEGIHGWIWDELQVLDFLHLSAAGFYQVDTGNNMIDPTVSYSYAQFYPAVGLTMNLGPAAVVRAAAFQFRTTRLFSQTIYPTSIAGFLLDRSEDIYTFRSEAHLSLDNTFGPFFLSNHVYYRESEYPPNRHLCCQKSRRSVSRAM